jgi:hypothetical protein
MSYTVVNGRIKNPGKFEGELDYVPHFWEAVLNGESLSDGPIYAVKITGEERLKFPRLGPRRRYVRLREDDQGFVREVR